MAENKKIVVVNLQKLEVAPIGAGGAEGSVFEEVPVVHEDTFTYEDEDPEVKDYKDVAGNTYYSSKKPGAVKINASIGMYDLETKAKFQGGKFTAGSEKIIFPRAGVSASGKANEKAIGLALVFTALKPTKAGVPIERWEDGEDTTLGG